MQPVTPFAETGVRFGEEPGNTADRRVIYLAGTAVIAAVLFSELFSASGVLSQRGHATKSTKWFSSGM
jgi:hypothetical protein